MFSRTGSNPLLQATCLEGLATFMEGSQVSSIKWWKINLKLE